MSQNQKQNFSNGPKPDGTNKRNFSNEGIKKPTPSVSQKAAPVPSHTEKHDK